MLVGLFGRSVMVLGWEDIKRKLQTGFQACTGFDSDGLKLIPLFQLVQKLKSKMGREADAKLGVLQCIFPAACFQQSAKFSSDRKHLMKEYFRQIIKSQITPLDRSQRAVNHSELRPATQPLSHRQSLNRTSLNFKRAADEHGLPQVVPQSVVMSPAQRQQRLNSILNKTSLIE